MMADQAADQSTGDHVGGPVCILFYTCHANQTGNAVGGHIYPRRVVMGCDHRGECECAGGMAGRERIVTLERTEVTRAEPRVWARPADNALDGRGHERTDQARGEAIQGCRLSVVVVLDFAVSVEPGEHRQAVLLGAELLNIAEEAVLA